jgi:cytochrome o ubiquinol oxidase operon protein cyoD
MIDSRITYKSYFVGLTTSIILTVAAYFSVTTKAFPVYSTYTVLAILAIVQILIQVIYFLHIGNEKGTRWNLISFIFSLITIFIIIAGSLWVMYNLNSNMM